MNEQDLNNTYTIIIEIPKGNVNNKYEYDEQSGEFRLDFIFENLAWPYNYGFFPNTQAGDGDTLDAIVLSSQALKQGQEVESKIIGMMDVLDRGEEDFKVICVPVDDKLSKSLDDITDVTRQQKQEWKDFNLEIARQKKKELEVRGFINREKTLEIIKNSLYLREFFGLSNLRL